MRSIISITALVFALCSVGDAYAAGADLSPKAVSKIRVGKSNTDQIERQFGEPQELKISGKGQIWTYVAGPSRGKRAAGGLLKTAGGALGKVPGGWGSMAPKPKAKKSKPSVLQVKFDQRGIVEDFNYRQAR